jgi:tripartite-type tricarboxylate transporter receptor subunit TctC
MPAPPHSINSSALTIRGTGRYVADVIDKFNKEINAGLADSNMRARLAELGGTVLSGTPAEFGKLVADETEKWGKVVKFAGIKPD